MFDDWFFVDAAIGLDMGLARSYIKGFFTVQPLPERTVEAAITPQSTAPLPSPPALLPEITVDESEINDIVGDPSGLTRLFLLFVDNRDETLTHTKAVSSHKLNSPLVNGGEKNYFVMRGIK